MSEPKKDTKWKPGVTGNPNGRPRKDQTKDNELLKMQRLLTRHSVEAVQKVIQIMQQAETPELQLKTATWIVDKKVVVDREIERRGLGKKPEADDGVETVKTKAPVLSLRMTGTDGKTTTTSIPLDDDEQE